MRTNRHLAGLILIVALATFGVGCRSEQPVHTQATVATLAPEDLAHRSIERREVGAVIWGIPVVNYDAMFQAMVNAAHGSFNQILYWTRPSDWKNQTLTPNTDALYLVPFFNTKDVGPMVLEIPPAHSGTIVGTVMDCWQTPLEAKQDPAATSAEAESLDSSSNHRQGRCEAEHSGSLPAHSARIGCYSPGNKRVSRLFPFTTDSDPLSPARKLSLSNFSHWRLVLFN
jgi:hypothetical protein